MNKEIKIRSIKENAVLHVIFTIVNIVAPMITFPYISRILLPEVLGKVQFFSSISEYGVMFASFGISKYGIRYVSKLRNNKKELSKVSLELLKINLITSIIVVGLLTLSSLFINKFQANYLLFLTNLIIILFSCIELDWFYSGLEQYAYITIQSIVFRIVSIVLIFVFVKSRSDYHIYALILSLTVVLKNIANYVYMHKYIDFKIEDKLEIMRHIKPMFVLFVSTLAINVYTSLDTVMLGFISGDTQTGLYSVAVKVKTIIIAAINAVSSVLYPRLAYHASRNDSDEYNDILRKSISMILMLSIPAMAFFIIEAKDSILILSGESFLDAIPCMRLQMGVMLFACISNITGSQILITKGRDECFMKAVVSGSIVDLILNFLLMPKYGCTGAAFATLIAEIVQAIIQIYYARDVLEININLKSITNILLSTSIACILVLIISPVIANIYIIIRYIFIGIIFLLVYIVMMLVLKDKMFKDLIGEVMKK